MSLCVVLVRYHICWYTYVELTMLSLLLQVIMDPSSKWDKSFISPSSSKKAKSTLEDKATYWEVPSSGTVELGLQYSKTTRTRRNNKKKTGNKKTGAATSTKKKGQVSSKYAKSINSTTLVETEAKATKSSNGDNGDIRADNAVAKKTTQTSLAYMKVVKSSSSCTAKTTTSKSITEHQTNNVQSSSVATMSKDKENAKQTDGSSIVLSSDDEEYDED